MKISQLKSLFDLYNELYDANDFTNYIIQIKNNINTDGGSSYLMYDKDFNCEIPDDLINEHFMRWILTDEDITIHILPYRDEFRFYDFRIYYNRTMELRQVMIYKDIIDYLSYIMMNIFLYKWKDIDSNIINENFYINIKLLNCDFNTTSDLPNIKIDTTIRNNKELTIEYNNTEITSFTYKDQYQEVISCTDTIVPLMHYYCLFHVDLPTMIKSARF